MSPFIRTWMQTNASWVKLQFSNMLIDDRSAASDYFMNIPATKHFAEMQLFLVNHFVQYAPFRSMQSMRGFFIPFLLCPGWTMCLLHWRYDESRWERWLKEICRKNLIHLVKRCWCDNRWEEKGGTPKKECKEEIEQKSIFMIFIANG